MTTWLDGLLQKITAFQVSVTEALYIIGGLLIEFLVAWYLYKTVVKLLTKINELREQNKGWREIGSEVLGTVGYALLLIAIGAFVGVFLILQTPITAIVTEFAVYIFT